MRNSDIGPSNLGKVEETQPATSGEVFSFLRETLYAGKNLSGDPDVTENLFPPTKLIFGQQNSFSGGGTFKRLEGPGAANSSFGEMPSPPNKIPVALWELLPEANFFHAELRTSRSCPAGQANCPTADESHPKAGIIFSPI